MLKRVVVTGMAGISPIGNDWQLMSANLKAKRTGVRFMNEWDEFSGLNTRLGAPAHFVRPAHYSRKQTRSMGRIALMATYATELALINAGLLNDAILTSGRTGVAYGSSAGSFEAVAEFGNMLINRTVNGLNATSYIRMMAHTSTVNIGLFFGINGRVYTTSSACTSSSQGIGYAYEAIKHGYQTVMVAGGAEELSASEAAVFDTLYATSVSNDKPEQSPRPFDRDRDGLVIGEGAGTFILEERDHALARCAHIHAELVGYGTNSDGIHVTQPDSASMQIAMRLALQDAGLPPSAIGYVSAHGTATTHGDVAESHATANLFGSKIPISSMKSYTGHTLGACGALEAMTAVNMMNENWFHATANLENIDPACAEMDYITHDIRKLECEYVMSNNFAFGGINTSLIFKKIVK